MLRAAWAYETLKEVFNLLSISDLYSALDLLMEHEKVGQQIRIVLRLP